MMADSDEIVEVVVLCSVEFSFAQMRGEGETFGEQTDCGVEVGTTGYELLGLFQTTELVLAAYFALTAFPRMEDVCVEHLLCFSIATELIEQGDVFQYEVVALLDQFVVFLKLLQTFGR